MFGIDKAQGKFLDKVMKYSGSDDQRKYDAMISAYNKFHDAVTALAKWADELRKTDETQATALRGVVDQQMVLATAVLRSHRRRLQRFDFQSWWVQQTQACQERGAGSSG